MAYRRGLRRISVAVGIGSGERLVQQHTAGRCRQASHGVASRCAAACVAAATVIHGLQAQCRCSCGSSTTAPTAAVARQLRQRGPQSSSEDVASACARQRLDETRPYDGTQAGWYVTALQQPLADPLLLLAHTATHVSAHHTTPAAPPLARCCVLATQRRTTYQVGRHICGRLGHQKHGTWDELVATALPWRLMLRRWRWCWARVQPRVRLHVIHHHSRGDGGVGT